MSTRKSQANPQPSITCLFWIRKIENRSSIRDAILANTREAIVEVFFEGILIDYIKYTLTLRCRVKIQKYNAQITKEERKYTWKSSSVAFLFDRRRILRVIAVFPSPISRPCELGFDSSHNSAYGSGIQLHHQPCVAH